MSYNVAAYIAEIRSATLGSVAVTSTNIPFDRLSNLVNFEFTIGGNDTICFSASNRIGNSFDLPSKYEYFLPTSVESRSH